MGQPPIKISIEVGDFLNHQEFVKRYECGRKYNKFITNNRNACPPPWIFTLVVEGYLFCSKKLHHNPL